MVTGEPWQAQGRPGSKTLRAKAPTALPSTKLEEGAGNLSPRQTRKWPGKRKRL